MKNSFSITIFLIFNVSLNLGFTNIDNPYLVARSLEKKGDTLLLIRTPLAPNLDNSLNAKLSGKKVLKSKLIDDAEDISSWSHAESGSISLSSRFVKTGKTSLHLSSPTHSGSRNPGRDMGPAVARLNLKNEDWSGYNRLSFWVYPDIKSRNVVLPLILRNDDGALTFKTRYGLNECLNYADLIPGQWNRVIWEIPHINRTNVRALEFFYMLRNHEPCGDSIVNYYIDNIEIEQVEDPEHYLGWAFQGGKISFCHIGYSCQSEKIAIAVSLKEPDFSVIDKKTGQVVLKKSIRKSKSAIGEFLILDFSELQKPGTYYLKSGDTETQPFSIADNIWNSTIEETLNFFFSERCGFYVPGVHDVCHGDIITYHGNKQIINNGGWHDAGDMAQFVDNTALADYSMFNMAKTLIDKKSPLAGKFYEESVWGLDWLLKTRFGDGYRTTDTEPDIYTDGILGTVDDFRDKGAQFNVSNNFLGAAVAALGSTVIQEKIKADYSLVCAEQDWKFAMDSLNVSRANLNQLALACLSSIDLYIAAKKEIYAKNAIDFSRLIMNYQQRTILPGMTVPLRGFFSNGLENEKFSFYSDSQGYLTIAIEKLIRTFPNHDLWPEWYTTLALYAEFLKETAKFTSPFNMIANTIVYKPGADSRYKHALGGNYYLQIFRWGDTGNNGDKLSRAKSLSLISRLRNDKAGLSIVDNQMQWILGRNSFNQSLMYGVGYDYSDQFTAGPGQMVGSLTVGTKSNNDEPFWASNSVWTYKEAWIVAPSLWLSLLSDYEANNNMVNGEEDFKISYTSLRNGNISIKANSKNDSALKIVSSNLIIKGSPVQSPKNGEIIWQGTLVNKNQPWVVIVGKESNMDSRQGLLGNSGL